MVTFKELRNAGVIAWGILLGVAGVISLVGIPAFIDDRVEKALEDEKLLRKISSMVRPSVIFDQKSSILVDQGAMEFVESIKTIPVDDKTPVVKKIIIKPKKHLPTAPLLTCLERHFGEIKVTRGQGFEWEYEFWYSMDAEGANLRFRLEIVP